MARLRTFLILGRVSNLPTVWSNCLAGWWLGGGGNVHKLPFLFAGATFLYLGGMFLNDAFDTEFDLLWRKDRPIPAGAVSLASVWRWGLSWLALGMVCLFWIGNLATAVAAALVTCIILYDAIHKRAVFSPVLMGTCRLLLYLLAAATGAEGLNGRAIWCAIALGAYVGGLGFVARNESGQMRVQYWPLAFAMTPIFLALVMNADGYRPTALLLSGVLALWIVRGAWFLLQLGAPGIGRTVSSLLAGIVLVDALAVPELMVRADAPHELGFAFAALFALALVLQRLVPAT